MSVADFLEQAAQLFERSDWPAARLTAEALRQVSPIAGAGSELGLSNDENRVAPPHDLEQFLTAGPVASASAAASIKAIYQKLPWFRSGRSHIPYTQVVGPGAMLHHDTVRFGLFFLYPGSDYPNHVHGADEIYIVVAGGGEWSLDHAPYELKQPGDIIEVPSMRVHALRSTHMPVLALWSWTGDITLDRYRFAE